MAIHETGRGRSLNHHQAMKTLVKAGTWDKLFSLLQMARYSGDEIFSSRMTVGTWPRFNMFINSRHEGKVAYSDEFKKAVINAAIIFTSECHSFTFTRKTPGNVLPS